MKNKLSALIKSRRFWTAVGGVLIVLCQDVLAMSAEQAQTVSGLLMAWIVGDSLKHTD